MVGEKDSEGETAGLLEPGFIMYFFLVFYYLMTPNQSKKNLTIVPLPDNPKRVCPPAFKIS